MREKRIIYILLFLLLFQIISFAEEPLEIIEDDNYFLKDEEVMTEDAQVIISDPIAASSITTFIEKSVVIEYECKNDKVIFYAFPIGFENIEHTYQWEYSLDGKNFIPILNETNNFYTLKINKDTINWYIRVYIKY